MDNLSTRTNIIQRYLNGSASREELLELLAWIKENEEHVRFFNQVCHAWEGTNFTSENEQQTELALVRLHRKIEEAENAQARQESNIYLNRNKLWMMAKIAAIITGAVIVISFFFFYNKYQTKNKHNQFVTAIAPLSQKSQLILPDGTNVWLNSGTTLRYSTAYGEKSRDIYLNGEAFFSVTRNRTKPFVVHTSSLLVKALGTSFNVKCYTDDKTIETTLVEGKLEVSRVGKRQQGSNRVILHPYEKAIFSKSAQTLLVYMFKDEKEDNKIKAEENLPIETASIETITSWKDQQLVFENETFDDLVKQLERWYGINIIVVNKNLGQNKYTGKFVNNESIEQVLTIISRTTPMKYSSTGKTITIE